MDPQMQQHAREAFEAIDAVLRAGPAVDHVMIQAAANAVIAVRNRAIEEYRNGVLTRATLDRANSLVSLAYGAEFPLSGLHLHRLEQTRDGLRTLVECEGGSVATGSPPAAGTPR